VCPCVPRHRQVGGNHRLSQALLQSSDRTEGRPTGAGQHDRLRFPHRLIADLPDQLSYLVAGNASVTVVKTKTCTTGDRHATLAEHFSFRLGYLLRVWSYQYDTAGAALREHSGNRIECTYDTDIGLPCC
jgi:hypothetical protein